MIKYQLPREVLYIVCGCLTDILIFPLFQYCMIDLYLQVVSTHGYVDLEIECSKILLYAFVLFRTFVFEKFMLCFVRSIKYLNDFCFVLSLMHRLSL